MRNYLDRLPCTVLACALLITGGSWYWLSHSIDSVVNERFEQNADALELAIQKRIRDYQHILTAGVGLFYASDHVSREEWYNFVKTLKLNQFYPGIQGVGYSVFIEPEALDAHIREIRAEGFPEYQVRPVAEREIYSSIVYLEPFDERNQRAFGYDMFSEAKRRHAMENARDNAVIATSGAVTLVQEKDEDIQKGFLMYKPFYGNYKQSATPPATVEERRARILGYVYSPFRMGNFMRGLLKEHDLNIHFSVYEGSARNPEALMYDSAAKTEFANASWLLDKDRLLTFDCGMRWTLAVHCAPDFYSTTERMAPKVWIIGGLVISALLFFLTRTLIHNERKAVALADEMTHELRERETLFRKLFELNPVGIALNSFPDGRFLQGNSALLKPTGYTEEEFAQLSYFDITPKEYMPEEEKALKTLREDGYYGPFEKEYIRKDGTRYPILLKGVLFENSQGESIILSAIQDITERKAAESKLKDAFAELNWYNEALNSTTIVAITDKAGTITYANDNFCTISGYSREHLIGNNHRILKSDTHDKAFFKNLYNTITSGKVWRGEICNRNKSGKLYWVDTSIVPDMDERGRPRRYIAFRIDITERKRMEQDLLEARQIAEKANISKSAFLATMSHEIRTPMNAVIGMTSLLLNTRLDEEQNEFVNTIRTSGDALLALINDILDFSKIESDKIELECVPFDLSDAITEPLDIVASKAREKEIQLTYEIDGDAPAVLMGDPTRIRQILINLAGNAIKFTPERGSVSLQVHCKRLQDDKVWVECAVTDTGIGMSSEVQSNLFKPFNQADSTITRKFGGTGLGLAISKKLAELMGGDITCRSIEGMGSCFTLAVPLRLGNLKRRVFEQDNLQLLRGKSMVVVDDNPVNLRLFESFAQTAGMEVKCFENPQTLLEQLDSMKVDILVADHQMPEFSGEDLARRVKTGMRASLPILLCSSAGLDWLDLPAGLFAGLLLKPVRANSFYKKVLSILAESSMDTTQSNKRKQGSQAIDLTLGERCPLHILVAEDNPTNQRVIRHLLEKMGYLPDVAGNGQEAVSALKHRDYDVILMDLEMPVMGGVEATTTLRATLPAARQPFIAALTANVLTEQKLECERAGMDDFLTKPVRVESLSHLLETAYEKRLTSGIPLAHDQDILDNRDPQPTQELLDARQVADLMGGELTPGCMEFLLEGFGDTFEREFEKLRSGSHEKNIKLACGALHALEGSAANLGMSGLSHQMEILHKAIREQDLYPTEAELEALYQLAERSLAAYRERGWVGASFTWYGDASGTAFSLDKISESEWLILNRLPTLKSELRSQWEKANQTGLMDEIEAFANALKQATPHCPSLHQYAVELLHAADSFDMTGIQKLLTLYGELLNRLKSY